MLLFSSSRVGRPGAACQTFRFRVSAAHPWAVSLCQPEVSDFGGVFWLGGHHCHVLLLG